jgi:hypothetical protein
MGLFHWALPTVSFDVNAPTKKKRNSSPVSSSRLQNSNMHSKTVCDYDFYFHFPFSPFWPRRFVEEEEAGNSNNGPIALLSDSLLRVSFGVCIYTYNGDDHYVSGERQMNPSSSDDVSCRVPFLWPFTSSSMPDEYRWGRVF